MHAENLLLAPDATPPRRSSLAPIRPIYVGVADAAAISGLSVTTINDALRAGVLTRYKVGSRTLIRVEQLDAWIASKAAVSAVPQTDAI
jgi:excisionase family DNA binding protein